MWPKRLLPCCNVELPIELVTEVLARLPVKSLLRFRCVCKSWLTLISSPDFASLHLARSQNNDDDDENTLLLTLSRRGGTNWMLRSARTFNTVTSKYCRKLHADNFIWPHGYCPCGNSVNGLILLFKFPSEIMLWNPIVGKSHKLPDLLIHTSCLGLGFSSSNSEYKVLAIAKDSLASVHVYTLSTHTWRRIVDYRESIVHNVQSHGVLIDGFICWITEDYDEEGAQMVMFDVNDEVFHYVTQPSADSDVCWRHLVAYRKWVGLLDVNCNSCNLWVMEKHKVPRTWSKLYTIDLQPRYAPGFLCFKENGQSIIASTEFGVELFNIETQQVKDLNQSSSFCYRISSFLELYCTLFKESLVLL